MTIDILIYLRRPIDDSERAILDQSLRMTRGIIAPWFTPSLATTVLVYFNPELTSAIQVLGAVRRLGYDARIVSL